MLRSYIYTCLVILLGTACNNSATRENSTISPADTLLAERDTFHLGDFVWYIEPAAAADLAKLKPEEFDTSESRNLVRDSALVSRNGGSLRLKLGNGRYKVFKDNMDEESDDFVEYSYFGRLPSAGSYFISGSFYEWYCYYLIRENNGDSVMLQGLPCFSPDKKYMLSWNLDLHALFTMNGFELFENTTKGIKPIGQREFNNWGPSRAAWESDSTVIVERVTWSEAENQENTDYIRLKKRKE